MYLITGGRSWEQGFIHPDKKDTKGSQNLSVVKQCTRSERAFTFFLGLFSYCASGFAHCYMNKCKTCLSTTAPAEPAVRIHVYYMQSEEGLLIYSLLLPQTQYPPSAGIQ